MYSYYNGAMGNWGIMGGGFTMLLVWVGLIVLIVWAIKSMKGKHGCCHNHNHDESSRALDILQERYAKGEINKEEFETKKKDLQA